MTPAPMTGRAALRRPTKAAELAVAERQLAAYARDLSRLPVEAVVKRVIQGRPPLLRRAPGGGEGPLRIPGPARLGTARGLCESVRQAGAVPEADGQPRGPHPSPAVRDAGRGSPPGLRRCLRTARPAPGVPGER